MFCRILNCHWQIIESHSSNCTALSWLTNWRFIPYLFAVFIMLCLFWLSLCCFCGEIWFFISVEGSFSQSSTIFCVLLWEFTLALATWCSLDCALHWLLNWFAKSLFWLLRLYYDSLLHDKLCFIVWVSYQCDAHCNWFKFLACFFLHSLANANNWLFRFCWRELSWVIICSKSVTQYLYQVQIL